MSRFYKNLFCFYSLVILGIAPQASAQRNVILYIGDGFGLAPKTAARMALGQGQEGKRFSTDQNYYVMAIDKLRYVTTATTHSLNSWITDSAPGASVYACGKDGKVDNEVISLNPATGEPVETILERAKKAGYAVGLVTTTRITHATPAAFASHIWFRDLEDYIAAQYLASSGADYEAIYNAAPSANYRYNAARDWELPATKVGVEVDVLLGGGARHFLPKDSASVYSQLKDASGNPVMDKSSKAVKFSGRRVDNIDLISKAVASGYTYVNSRDALLKLNPDDFTATNNKKLIGLFHSSHMNYEQDRQMIASWEPSLSEMTQMAIEVLKRKGGTKGFFLMVEAGRIDHLGHANTGGIEVVSDGSVNRYTISANKETYGPDGEGNYSATPATSRTTGIYGSDYMIKEVIAFDYAIAEGRKLLDQTAQTLIISTSDHECGGFAVVGLYDKGDKQNNGTLIRTYASEIKKSTVGANPKDGVLTRGDGGAGGWYPQYKMVEFQGKNYPVPSSDTARRIVIAYGSNPVTNGNGTKAGGTPGNHTPQDIWVGADDNTDTHAKKITGKGLLDNTDLHPIMFDFLQLSSTTNIGTTSTKASSSSLIVFPVPSDDELGIKYFSNVNGKATLEIVDADGKVVDTVKCDIVQGQNEFTYNLRERKAGIYFLRFLMGSTTLSAKFVK